MLSSSLAFCTRVGVGDVYIHAVALLEAGVRALEKSSSFFRCLRPCFFSRRAARARRFRDPPRALRLATTRLPRRPSTVARQSSSCPTLPDLRSACPFIVVVVGNTPTLRLDLVLVRGQLQKCCDQICARSRDLPPLVLSLLPFSPASLEKTARYTSSSRVGWLERPLDWRRGDG